MSAWKACDIRGPYPEEVSAELFYSIGSGAARMLPPGGRALVAGDFCETTPELKSALARGLVRSGARVLDAGQAATPVAYFAQRSYGTDAIFVVTASHSPAG